MTWERVGSDTPQARAERSGEIWEARQRARREVADQFETIDDPDRIPIDQHGGGFGPTEGFFGWAQPQEAAHELDPEFEHVDLGPEDVEPADDGFRPTEDVQRREVAYGLEGETPLEEVDPFDDVEPVGEGAFGLAEPRQRDLAAYELDDEFPHRDLTRDDVEPADDGFRPTEDVQREHVASELDPEFPDVDLGPENVEPVNDGFGLREDAQREIVAAEFEDETPLEEVDPDDDIRDVDDGWELRDDALERAWELDPGFF